MRVALQAAIFCVFKAIVLVAPLAASHVYPLATYGALEWTIALATTLLPVAALGLTAAIPYFLLHVQKADVAASIRLYGRGLTVVGVVAAAAALVTGHLLWGLVIASTAAFAGQALWSAFEKAGGRPARASAYDAGFYVALLGAVTASAVSGVGLEAVVGGLLLYLLVLFWRSFSGVGGGHQLRVALAYGMPFVIPTVAMVGLVNSGRAIAGYALPSDQMGLYGFVFRIVAPAVLVHQLLGILYFRQLYATRDSRSLDRYFMAVAVGVGFVAGGLFLAVPLVDTELSDVLAMAKSDPNFARIHYWLSVQMILWVGLALVEPIMARENRAGAQTAVLSVVLAAFVAAAAIAHSMQALSLTLLVCMHVIALAVALLLIIRSLATVGVRLPRLAVVAIALLGSSIAGMSL